MSRGKPALRDRGILDTAPDPQDRRRTLASVTAAHRRRVAKRVAIPVDNTVVNEIGEERAQIVIPLPTRIAELLSEAEQGPILATLRPSTNGHDGLG